MNAKIQGRQMNIITPVTGASRKSLSNTFGLSHLPVCREVVQRQNYLLASLDLEMLVTLPSGVGKREESCLKPTLYMILSIQALCDFS